MAAIADVEAIPKRVGFEGILSAGFDRVVEVGPCDACGGDVYGVLWRGGAAAIEQVTIAQTILHGLKVWKDMLILGVTFSSSPRHQEDGLCAALVGGCGEFFDGSSATLPVTVRLLDARDLALFLEDDPSPLVKGILAGHEVLS